MKIFIILCLLLGFLHIQVDGSPVNSSYENENTFEGQIKSLLSKIEHIILETNNSMVKVRDQILEHLDERYALMEKQIWHLCPSGTVTNSTGCLNVTETDADDIQERFLSVTNDIRACSKDDPRHLKELLKLIKKWKKEPSLFAHERNISASHDEWPQLMYEKQYHEKNSWIENMIRMESHYIQCIAENIRVLQRPWNIILSVIIPFPPNDELYKNFTAVKLINDTKDSWVGKTMRQTFLDMKHIAEVTNKSVVEIHNDDSIFVENQINRLEKQIVSAFSNQTTLQNSLAPKNITQFIERTVSMVKKNISQCFNEFVEKKNSEMKSYREGEEKMVGMSVDDANIPKDPIGQQNWLYTGLYTVKLDVRESMNDSKATYIQCMKSKIDFLKHLSEPSAVNELIADSSPLTEDE